MVLFGNKCDDKENIKVKEEDIKKMKEKYKLEYFETSAKNGTNVNELFEYLVKLTLKTRGFLKKVGLPEDIPFEAIQIKTKPNQRFEVKKIKKVKKRKFFQFKKNLPKDIPSESNKPEKEFKKDLPKDNPSESNGPKKEFKHLNKYIDF